MPKEMRFCRSCGNRLGEGPAEYTETVRFPNAATAQSGRGTTPFIPGFSAPMAQQTGSGLSFKPKRRLSGMTWVLIVIAIFFAGGGLMSTFVRSRRPRPSLVSVERSYFGVNEFENGSGGVTFRDVWPPGSPADKAGLVGGDIITSFDGHPVKDEDEMMDLLRQTPVGKTVEVVFIRDGETQKTKLTTVSRAEFNQLGEAFSSRAAGQGQLGFDDDDAKRVPIAGTQIYGVQLNDISPSGPAALAGLQEGDVITEFDGTPIRTVSELVVRVRRAIPYSTVKVIVMRGTEQFEIPVKIGKRG
jgi:S1-C subfamily serine protease